MDLQILPLAITMMVGPQIMSAIIFVTTPRAVRVSSAFLLGVAVATTVGVAITRGLAALPLWPTLSWANGPSARCPRSASG